MTIDSLLILEVGWDYSYTIDPDVKLPTERYYHEKLISDSFSVLVSCHMGMQQQR